VLDDIGKLISSGASDDTIIFSKPQPPDWSNPIWLFSQPQTLNSLFEIVCRILLSDC
jgi:hypothetical protein